MAYEEYKDPFHTIKGSSTQAASLGAVYHCKVSVLECLCRRCERGETARINPWRCELGQV